MSLYHSLYRIALLCGMSKSKARKSAKHSAYSQPF